MEFLTEALDLVLDQKFILIFSSGVFAIALGRLSQQYNHGELDASILVKFGLLNSVLVLFASLWLSYVNASVPAPYLDEFFHIPQTQVYCQGRYSQWDDKITTPPGLTPSSPLRSNYALHSGFNIALFPVLFFFSGLFYTDVLSTCVVLAAYSNHKARVSSRSGPPSFLNDVYTVALGVCALSMRQTNVFWVVVYMGGLEAVAALKSLNREPADASFNVIQSQFQLFPWRYTQGHVYDPSLGNAKPQYFPWKYTHGEVYDPPVGDAWPADLALCVFSLACAALCNFGTMLRRIYPHIVTLSLFVGFVVWNGGVVLGDKSNHVATLHAAQMLYIWPLTPVCHKVIVTSHRQPASRGRQPLAENKSALLRAFNAVFSNGPLLSALLVAACLMVGLLIVHFNTIIHPFTLADNRHYTFYVFRYSILRGTLVRHALVAVYVFCGWLSWSALYDSKSPKPGLDAPPIITISVGEMVKPELSQSPSTSTVLILLLTKALSLMTAPLVEPRYFILPWVFWRLLVPAWSIDELLGTHQIATDKPSSIWLVRFGNRFDIRLVLETIWFLLINVMTMYIFLTRPFYWKAEDGTLLDGGNVQRFMW
ncbi:alpha- glucosyltransferase alg10 [Apiospora phragmitis]|uniref:Dol-P-Glc:Glc(2)Man(9)GlcNAc(2)-PP-Dol alpha-1,2-glucosyltransferase n=1 Tax=Apiospora phragmitis TaxID=2905665 RepID=A0ABR1X748_9PEZI